MECSATLTAEEFLTAARHFVKISDNIGDRWKLYQVDEIHRSYLKKELYIDIEEAQMTSLRGEYVIFYNLSYGVPAFSFNIWHPSGVLLTLDEVRRMSFKKLDKEQFYSTITQQEHPLFQRPYFIIHPCHTPELLSNFKAHSTNIIVTFLGLITPLIRLNLPNEYGLTEVTS